MKGFYHESNGLYFKRADNGDVHLVKTEDARDSSPIVFEQIIPKNIWYSIVCVVSKDGELSGRYLEAEKFHG